MTEHERPLRVTGLQYPSSREEVFHLQSIFMTHRHFRRRRPPWWPEDEPWPPTGPPGAQMWRRMRGRFFWRVGFFLSLLFIFIVGACTLLFWFVATSLGMINLPERSPLFLPFGIGRPFFPLWGIIPVVLVMLGLLIAARALRGATMPIGDLMEAAGRVAEGDYTARVPERGPGEVRSLSNAFNEMTTRLQLNDEQRRKLLADISHELRTPLTVIQGNLEGLLDGVYPRDDAHLTAILEESRLMSRLIDDLRTLALAEAGSLKLQKVPTDVAALIKETISSFYAQADAAGIQLRAEIAEGLPMAEIDPARIREVLENLITNALHYTPNGGEIRVAAKTTVAANTTSAATDSRRVEISVSDTGAGISREDLPHIFDRFYKSRESRGTGLGLAIAKDLVMAHGGEITAPSDSHHGTTIRFTLPL